MSALTPLDREAAERFLAEVEWAQRFTTTVNGSRGFSQLPVYSMEELLRVARGGAVVIAGESVVQWVGDVLGDLDLADAVREASKGVPLFGQAAAVLPLLAERFDHALTVVRADSVPSE